MDNISREELHRYVWQQPLKQLAVQWALDTRKLTELCNTFDIVRPKSGYWTQMLFGTDSTPIPLDCSKFTADHQIDLSGIARRKAQVLPKITVPKRLANPEPEIKRAKALYQAPSYRYDYIWIAPYPQAGELVALSVSEKQFPRALRILDTLLKYFKKQGWAIGTKRERRTYMNTVVIQDQTVCFRLREELKQQTRPLSEKELADKNSGHYFGREKVNTPSGNLVLTLEHYIDGQQSTWRDNKKTPLEDYMPEIIVGMKHAATSVQETAEQRAEQQARWQREREIREKTDQLQSQWNDCVENLLFQFDRWQRSEQCRLFISKVKTKMLSDGNLTIGQQQWLDWASDIASRLDPVSEIASSDFSAWSLNSSFTKHLSDHAVSSNLGNKACNLSKQLSLVEIEAGLKELGLIDTN